MKIRALSVCLLLAVSASAGELGIARVFTGWRDAASFKRISEYFDGREHTGGQLVIRTHHGQRAGYYFLVRLTNPGAPLPVKVNLQVISTTDAKPRTHTFSAELKTGKPVLNLGLTGDDWPDAKLDPVAWRLDVVDADGRVLVTEKSYLWDKPATR